MAEKIESGSASLDVVKWALVVALVAAAVWGNGHYVEISPLYRALGVLAVGVVAVAIALQTVQGKAFNQLRKESLVELRKVVWPTRPEALQTTLMVVVFVAIVALLLFVMDWALSGVVSMLIG